MSGKEAAGPPHGATADGSEAFVDGELYRSRPREGQGKAFDLCVLVASALAIATCFISPQLFAPVPQVAPSGPIDGGSPSVDERRELLEQSEPSDGSADWYACVAVGPPEDAEVFIDGIDDEPGEAAPNEEAEEGLADRSAEEPSPPPDSREGRRCGLLRKRLGEASAALRRRLLGK